MQQDENTSSFAKSEKVMADRPPVDCRGKTGDAVGRSLLLENNQVLPQPVLPDPTRLLGWNHSVVGPEDGSDVSQMAEQEEVSLVCLETSA